MYLIHILRMFLGKNFQATVSTIPQLLFLRKYLLSPAINRTSLCGTL